jgi:hypothetical protein
MWDDGCACFAVGTTEDGVTPNKILALDAEIWPLIALPGMAAAHSGQVIATIGARLRGADGYAYSYADHGLWTEGTAQAALAQHLFGHDLEAAALETAVATQWAPSGGIYATAGPQLATGFGSASDPKTERYYYRLPHLAATAWAALAEKKFNPFTDSQTLP